MNDDRIIHNEDEHVPPEAVAGAHDADGTTGRVAGTGSGAIAGGIVGSAAGPIGTVIGAVAGGVLGAAAGDAAHKIGDDHDDVNVETGSGGDLGKASGAGAGGISGAIIGSAAGPVGTVAGAVAGGMLGAAAGDAAKDMGGDGIDDDVPPAYAGNSATIDPVVGTTPAGTPYTTSTMTPGNAVPGIQTGGHAVDGTPDTRGVMEKTADAVTGDNLDDKTGKTV